MKEVGTLEGSQVRFRTKKNTMTGPAILSVSLSVDLHPLHNRLPNLGIEIALEMHLRPRNQRRGYFRFRQLATNLATGVVHIALHWAHLTMSKHNIGWSQVLKGYYTTRYGVPRGN